MELRKAKIVRKQQDDTSVFPSPQLSWVPLEAGSGINPGRSELERDLGLVRAGVGGSSVLFAWRRLRGCSRVWGMWAHSPLRMKDTKRPQWSLRDVSKYLFTPHPLSTSLKAGIIVPTVQQELWKRPAIRPTAPTKGGKEVKWFVQNYTASKWQI